jgi:hypothetical protein
MLSQCWTLYMILFIYLNRDVLESGLYLRPRTETGSVYLLDLTHKVPLEDGD